MSERLTPADRAEIWDAPLGYWEKEKEDAE
jgi:hypothetical protein